MKYIIFDFDGTLADSTEVLMHAWNLVAEQHQFEKLHKEDIPALKNLSIQERARKFRFPMYKLPVVLPKIYRYMKEHIDEIKLFDGIKEVLNSLGQMGYHIIILSSNDSENIKLLLKQEQVNAVSQVLTSSKIFGKDAILKKFMKQENVVPEQCLYVGDEVRDILACKKVRVPVMWVSWGVDSYELIEKEKPDYIVNTPTEIIQTLTKKTQ
ncbi:HAD-IA family hydrolase [Bacillus sp. DNRA2]|uniref:HAD-IA family hydrolase n=1 Tax=Bacillus sp. DNRA2 TaxID=2723053 RepID=UPI00145D8942|nr:HAD-IA family hydrolase [Bacillus sp. DNRA2]NMD71746.1 HAD-IA family hydrolase [Bacillus sp. DNRA2]